MRVLFLTLLAAGLAACTPTLDWREVRPEGSRAQAMFPCKPGGHARRVALAGTQVELSLFACTAGQATYALAFADVGDPARVGPALAELSSSASSNLQAAGPADAAAARVAGMTPNERAVQWRLAGKLPDGQAVQERAVFFAHGTQVYQATVLGQRLDTEALDTFFGALRVGG